MDLEEISKINIPAQDMITMILINTEHNSARLQVILSTQARILSLLDNATMESLILKY